MLCKRDCLRAYLAGRRHDFDADLSRRRFPDSERDDAISPQRGEVARSKNHWIRWDNLQENHGKSTGRPRF